MTLKYGNLLGGKQVDPTNLAEGDEFFLSGGKFIHGQSTPTNQGPLSILWQSKGPETTTQTSTTSFTVLQRRNAADTANENITGVFEAPYTGDFFLLWTVTNMYTTGSGSAAAFKVDVTGATTVTLSPQVPATTSQLLTEEWVLQMSPANARASITFLTKVTLSKGTNTFTPSFKHTSVGVAASNDEFCRFEAAILGTGGSGTIFQQLVRDAQHTTTVTTTSTSFSDIEAGITDGSFTVPATGTYMFEVVHTFEAITSNTECQVDYQFLIDGVVVAGGAGTRWTRYVQRSSSLEVFEFSKNELLAVTAGTHTWKLQWRRANGTNTPRVENFGPTFCRLAIRGGAAVSASLDTRGDSITYDAQAVPPVLASNTFTYLVGFAGQDGTLRSLSVGMDGVTVTASTLTCNLLINGVVKATAVLSTSNPTWNVDDTSTPVVVKGDKLEIRFTTTSTYQNSSAAAAGVQAVASFSTSTAVIKAWHQSAYMGTVGSPSATTWTGVSTILTLADEITTTDITRSTDTITFVRGGLFQFNFWMDWAIASGSNVFMGLRARKTNGTPATMLSTVMFLSSGNDFDKADLNGLINVSAGDTIQIQYCKSGAGTTGTFAPSVLNGETPATSRLTIVRIS